MASNRVFIEKTNETVFRSDNLQEAIEWLLARKDQFDPIGTYVDEVDENDKVIGWWELQDLIDEV